MEMELNQWYLSNSSTEFLCELDSSRFPTVNTVDSRLFEAPRGIGIYFE